MNLLENFSQLTDPRVDRTKVYPLETIIFLTIAAVVAGAETFVDIEEFGHIKLNWLKKYVSCPDDRIPSHDTIGDFYSRINPKEFEKCFINWTGKVCGISEGELIAIDGKRLRGSYDRYDNKAAIHMVSAWANKNEMVLGQVMVNDKSNEITAIPALLNILEIKGAIVSIDAMGCQKEIAEQIIGKEADYILALKGNQGALKEQVESYFQIAPLSSEDEFTIKSHGRIETRKCSVLTNLELLEETQNWKGIHAVIRIDSTRTEILTDSRTQETRYYITSLKKQASQMNQLIREHWAVENKLHWVLDVVFNEDLSRIRKDNAPENFSIIRRVALNLIKLDKTPKVSQRNKRNRAAWSDKFLEQLLKI
jgi:predicted transposase YbfD/YdcC